MSSSSSSRRSREQESALLLIPSPSSCTTASPAGHDGNRRLIMDSMSRRRTRHHHEVEDDRPHPDGWQSRFPRSPAASSSSASASSLASGRRMSCRRMTCLSSSSRLFFIVSCLVLLISWSWESVSAQESASHPPHSSHGRTKGTVDPRVITYPGTTLDRHFFSFISSPFHDEK